MTQTAINLYTVRELEEPMLDIVDRVADAGYDGVQISGGFQDATPEEVSERIEERGLDVPPAHIGVEVLEDDLEATLVDFKDTLRTPGAVVPSLSRGYFDSAHAVDRAAERLAALADELSTHGWDLHYHNHAREFTDLGDESALERLIRQVEDVGIELDVGWALVGGADPIQLIREYGDSIDLLHMKDMDVSEEDFREIGEGDVDMAACADAGRDVGVDWLIYEHDDPADPAASIDAGAAFLNDL
ncbi:MAG: sugar phosphate isomerase/epimerase family protein [Halobacteriales archaeon]